MSAQHFAVQAIAFEVADDLAVEVDLVQVAAAVVEAIEPAAVGQLGLDQVAEFVVVVVQAASRALFFEQLAEGIVGEAQGLCVALAMSRPTASRSDARWSPGASRGRWPSRCRKTPEQPLSPRCYPAGHRCSTWRCLQVLLRVSSILQR